MRIISLIFLMTSKAKIPNEHTELEIGASSPFVIHPPPPQPAARQRKGTGWVNPNLPQLPFSLAVVGPRNSGKSTVIRNLLDASNEGSYGAAFKFSNIVFYSPTMEFDKTITSLPGLKNVYGPPTPVPVLVQDIMHKQDSYRAQEDMADVLIVFEDCTNTRDAWKELTVLGYTGRHYGIHSIAVAHKLTSIPRGNRTQIQQWLLFKPHEESEREWILYMFSRLNTRWIWQNAITRAWDIPFNFIYVDFERVGMHNVYRSGFNDPLFTEDQMALLSIIEHGEDYRKPDLPVTGTYPPRQSPDSDEIKVGCEPPQPKCTPSRRGRPKGSKNKSKRS
jgi:hypothetical protein